MDFKGTKGKWVMRKTYIEKDTPIFSVNSKEGILSHCYNLQLCCGIQERTKANAQLMASAPELLQALDDLVTAIESNKVILAEEIHNAKQVIEKATKID